MVILTQYHTEIHNRGISTIGASEIFPVSRMPRFQRLHCNYIANFAQNTNCYYANITVLISYSTSPSSNGLSIGWFTNRKAS